MPRQKKYKYNLQIQKRKHSLFRQFFSDPLISLFGVLFIVLFLLIYFVYVIERKNNPDINNFFDSFWYAIVTITTVGYGDIVPKTVVGRVVGIFMLLFGVIIFAAFSGKIASVLLDRQLKMNRGLIQFKKN